jgi:hypothetical protein
MTFCAFEFAKLNGRLDVIRHLGECPPYGSDASVCVWEARDVEIDPDIDDVQALMNKMLKVVLQTRQPFFFFR